MIILHPIVPHITQQIWIDLEFPGNLIKTKWPQVETEALKASSYEMVIQINGKLRGKIEVAAGADKDSIEKLALANENIQRYVEGHEVLKIILVPNKLINLIVKF